MWVAAYWPAFIEHPRAQQATEVGVWLRLLLLPAILLAGFLGNGLTMALMRRASMRGHSYGPYMTALAASDSLALFIRLVFWVNLLAGALGRPVLLSFRSRGACAAVEYVCTANHVLCSWLVVCLTYERVVVVVLPLKSARFVKAATSVKVVAVAALSSVLLMSYVAAIVRWVPEAGGCVIAFPRDLHAHFVLATVFVSLLPLFLICCGNLVIVVELYRQNLRRANLLAGGSAKATTTTTTKVSTTKLASGGGKDTHVGHEGSKCMRVTVTDPGGRVAHIEGEKGLRCDANGSELINSAGEDKSATVPRPEKSLQSEAGEMPLQSTKGEHEEAGPNANISGESLPRSSGRGSCNSRKLQKSGSNIRRTPDRALKSDVTVNSLSVPTTNTESPPNSSRRETSGPPEDSRGSQPTRPPTPISTTTTTTTTTTTAATKSGSQSSNNEQHVRRVTLTLLCVSLAFLLLVMPNALLVLALGLRPDWSSLQPLLDPLALLWDGNFAINFYLYVFAGANFRAEVFRMLGWAKGG